MLGNVAVVKFRHLPGKLRREKWEVWLALPMFAYIASVSSGLVTGYYLRDGIYAVVVAVLLFGITLTAIILVGVFIGLQDRASPADLESVTDLGAFHADIVAIEKSGQVPSEVARRAREQLRRLTIEDAKPSLKRLEAELLGAYSITSDQGPARGAGRWQDANDRRISIKVRYVVRHVFERFDLLCGPVISLVAICALLLTFWRANMPLSLGWSSAGYLIFVSVVALISAYVTYVAARADTIYRVRLHMAEREHWNAAESIIVKWEQGNIPSGHPASAVQEPIPWLRRFVGRVFR